MSYEDFYKGMSEQWLQTLHDLEEQNKILKQQNEAYSQLLGQQTELLLEYSNHYRGTAKSFIPDVDFTKLEEYISKLTQISPNMKNELDYFNYKQEIENDR